MHQFKFQVGQSVLFNGQTCKIIACNTQIRYKPYTVEMQSGETFFVTEIQITPL